MKLRAQVDKTVYNSVDFAKLLCAILVVVIHVTPFGWQPSGSFLSYMNYGLQQYLARLAVPAFFVFSGYFLYRKTLLNEFSWEPTKKYAWKLFKLYVIWTLIYLPLSVWGILHDKKGVIHATLGYIRNTIMTGSYLQLWYLNATIFAVLLISFLLYKKVSIKKILLSAFVLYCIGLLAQSWFGLIEPLRTMAPDFWQALKLVQKVIGTTRDGLFDGFLFVSIGMFLAYYDIELSKKKAGIWFIISMILLLGEAFFVKYFHFVKAHDMYFFLVPAVFFGFVFISQVRLPDRPAYRMMRLLSILIFYLHPWIRTLLSKAMSVTIPPMHKTSLLFILTIIVTTLVSWAIIRLSARQGFLWLKNIYR